MNESTANTNIIRLPSGRQLGYSDLGAVDGQPILYCHGMPGSRFEPYLFQSRVTRQGLRVIGLERPGYGLTSPLPGRVVGDEVADVLALADRLELDRFDVIGFSGGGPQALACAAHIPDRVGRVSLVGSWAPFVEADLDGMLSHYRELWYLARADFPAFSRELRAAIEHTGGGYELLLSGAVDNDRTILEHPDFSHSYKYNIDEALRHGLEGMLDDASAAIADWPFRCSDIQTPVQIFHGQCDGNSPVGMGRWLGRELPHADVLEWPDATHFDAFRRWNEVLVRHAVS